MIVKSSLHILFSTILIMHPLNKKNITIMRINKVITTQQTCRGANTISKKNPSGEHMWKERIIIPRVFVVNLVLSHLFLK
jgi:hypothetical protein